MHERGGELLQAPAVVVELPEEGAVHSRLERLLEDRDQHHGEQRERDRRARDDHGLLRADGPPEHEDDEAARDEDGRRGEEEAHGLPDDVVHVHQSVARDRVGDDPEVERVPEAPERVDVDAVDRQKVGEVEGARDCDREKPELGLGPLPRVGRMAVGVGDEGDRQREIDQDQRRHERIKRRRLDVPAPRVRGHAVDERAAEVLDDQEEAGGVPDGEHGPPPPPRRPGQHADRMEDRRRHQAHARPEHHAPPQRGIRVGEVVEREDVEVPRDDRQGHPGEGAADRIRPAA